MPRNVLVVILLPLLLLAAGPSEQEADSRLQWKPTKDSNFEVGTQLRPWTVVDEGWDVIMENMAVAGVQGLPPILGRDVEEMKLDGYAKFVKEIAEDWGVETKETGRALRVGESGQPFRAEGPERLLRASGHRGDPPSSASAQSGRVR